MPSPDSACDPVQILPGAPGSPQHSAYLQLQRLAARQQQQVSELLRSSGLSGPQFNVLRILRGAGESGLTCAGISERLLVHDPDVTRLLDRLEKAGYVRRERQSSDRRVVLSFLTPAGEGLLQTLDAPLTAHHAAQFAALTPEQLAQLSELLAALF